jgi:hypothetical protein
MDCANGFDNPDQAGRKSVYAEWQRYPKPDVAYGCGFDASAVRFSIFSRANKRCRAKPYWRRLRACWSIGRQRAVN